MDIESTTGNRDYFGEEVEKLLLKESHQDCAELTAGSVH